MKKDFRVNDWVLCEMQVMQIVEVPREPFDNIYSVATGRGTLGGQLPLFALDLTLLKWADRFKKQYDKLHEIKHINLNYPDIHRWFVATWIKACEAVLIKDGKTAYACDKELEEFMAMIFDLEYQKLGSYIKGVRVHRLKADYLKEAVK